MSKQDKSTEYAVTIMAKIGELFDEDSDSDYKINVNELEDEENMTHFLHALCNIMPTHIYNKFTGDDKNMLAFNYIANQLVFQYSKKVD